MTDAEVTDAELEARIERLLNAPLVQFDAVPTIADFYRACGIVGLDLRAIPADERREFLAPYRKPLTGRNDGLYRIRVDGPPDPNRAVLR